MSQSSYLQNNKRKKRQYDDGGYESDLQPQKKQKHKKDFSKQREQKRGEFV
jgi:hypothetical protein